MKAGEFQPEFSGKMNFIFPPIDDLLRHSDDKPSNGITLCKSKNKVVAEYTPPATCESPSAYRNTGPTEALSIFS